MKNLIVSIMMVWMMKTFYDANSVTNFLNTLPFPYANTAKIVVEPGYKARTCEYKVYYFNS